MAKVTGPLMSVDARGKIADALVFIGWKGIKDVRMWLKPANPQSSAQGNVRTVIGGTGKAAGKTVSEGNYDSKLSALDVIPDQQTRQSFLVKYIKEHYFAGKGATLTGNFNSMIDEITGHTGYAAFQDGADSLGLVGFSVDYASVDQYEKALGIYCLAKAAVDLNFTGTPYSTTLADWTTTQVTSLVTDIEG